MRVANKKILMITTLFPSEERPYYCIYLLQLFDAVKALGYHVDILMPDESLPDGVIKQTEYRGYTITHIGYSGNLFMGIAGAVSSGFSQELRKFLGSQKPNIINIHFGSTAVCKAVISNANKMEIPTVMHYHGLNVFKDYYVAHPLLEKVLYANKVWLTNHADAIVGVSNKVCQIVSAKSRNDSVYTVYNGVDTRLFYPSEIKKNPVFTIVCVANLIPIKGHEYLLRAARDVIFNHGYNLKIKLIGNGPERKRLQELAEELGIENAVEFLGEQDYGVVAEEIRNADFYIMPSYFESLGCVYLEAMASGVAALGIKGCGIDEIITDKKNGYLAEPHNTEQIAERILYAIENPEEHARIAMAGYDHVINQYQWVHAAQSLARVYEEILHGSKDYA